MAAHIYTHHCSNLWCDEKYYDCNPGTWGYCPSCNIKPKTADDIMFLNVTCGNKESNEGARKMNRFNNPEYYTNRENYITSLQNKIVAMEEYNANVVTNINKEIKNLEAAKGQHENFPDPYSKFWIKCIPEIKKAYEEILSLLEKEKGEE